jgi:hypothetical protein
MRCGAIALALPTPGPYRRPRSPSPHSPARPAHRPDQMVEQRLAFAQVPFPKPSVNNNLLT